MTPTSDPTNTIAEAATAIAERLRNERDQAAAAMAQIERQISQLDLGIDRLETFSPQVGAEYQCPRCWIRHGVRSTFRPIPIKGRQQLFVCRACQFELVLP